MLGIALCIVVIELDVPVITIPIGQQGGKEKKKDTAINWSGESTLVSQNKLLK